MSVLQDYLNAQIAKGKYSVREYAKKIGVSKTTLTRKLSGESDFTLSEIRKIGRALGYESPSEFMRDAEISAALATPDDSSDGFTIQDKASGSIILQARRVDWDGGDEA